MSELIFPYGTGVITGQIKLSPQDFKVTEQLGFDLTGQGEHLFLYVEKIGLTTFQLIEKIAQYTGVAVKLIGYSGLKDKQAVTQQWLSVQLPGCKQFPQIPDGEGYKILNQEWHDKKLRVGSHRFNDFAVTIREIEGDSRNLHDIIEQINRAGFANYFGEQRFGAKGDNVAQALRLLGNRHKSKRLNRNKKSLYLSALRSELFNQVLNLRIAQGIWSEPVAGDLFMLSGSQSIFSQPVDGKLIQRYQAMDVHSALSLLGGGESRLQEMALAIENEVFAHNPEITQLLQGQDIKRSYRSNRAIAHNLSIELAKDATLRLKVRLERGVFLTSLLAHFMTTNANDHAS